MTIYDQNGKELTTFNSSELDIIRAAMSHYFLDREGEDNITIKDDIPAVTNLEEKLNGDDEVYEFFRKLDITYYDDE